MDGAFCGAWYDSVARRWVIFNDRLGLLPVFYTVHNGRLIVAPSATLVWRAADMSLDINEEGISDLLRTMNTTEDHTLLRHVHWLRGGHAIIAKRTSDRSPDVRTDKYWEFSHLSDSTHNPEDAIEEYLHVLGEAIGRQTTGALSVMLGVSGGMDSRLILARASQLGCVPTCFTTGYPFSEDVRFGRRLAGKARTPHTFVPLDASLIPQRLERFIVETDGLHGARHMAFGSPIPDYLANFTGSVLLEGHFHGIIGGACVPADEDLPIERAPHACAWARKHAHGGAGIETINRLLQPDIAQRTYEQWQSQIDSRYDRAPATDPWQRAEYAIINGRSGRNDVLGPGLQRHDVVVRSPATTCAFIDWAARTPAQWRRSKQLYMDTLRRRFPQFARVQKADFNGLPVAEDALLREYCWQTEKIGRWWAYCRHPQTRKWGTGAGFNTAITFEAWKHAGGLTRLIEPGARVLAWVNADQLHNLWQRAMDDPTTSALVLTLGTIETYIRHLEQCPPLQGSAAMNRIRFRTFATGSAVCEETACVSC